MEIGGATVSQLNSGMLTCAHLLLSHNQFICIWHSQEMDVHSFTIEKLDLNSPFKDIMEDEVYFIYSMEVCAVM